MTKEHSIIQGVLDGSQDAYEHFPMSIPVQNRKEHASLLRDDTGYTQDYVEAYVEAYNEQLEEMQSLSGTSQKCENFSACVQ